MIATLHIHAAIKNGITFLSKSFFTPPFKVANITEDKKSAKLDLMLMCSSPGILDEDEYQLKIELDVEASVQLHTQSYQRLFTMKKGATQTTEVHLQKGSSFVYLPHPAVPHENSSFKAINKIYLENGCSLIWGEVLTCGRKLNGEVFKFSKYHNITEVYHQYKLVIKENLLMQPLVIDVNGIGQLNGFTHQATLLYLNEKASVKDISEEITDYLNNEKEIVFGITEAPWNGLIIRILGQKAEQLHELLKTISNQFCRLRTHNSELTT